MTELVLLPHVRVDDFQPHPLHATDRCWVETNCYTDLWIELLHALGLEPEAAFGSAARQDFEDDQFGFTKIPLNELESLYGLRVQELAIYEDVAVQIARQMARRRICLVEVDPYYLPDAGDAGYRSRHGKTTIAPNRLDIAGRRLEYFHNAGYFALEGEDFDGLFRPSLEVFRPYVEFTALEPARRPREELRRLAAGFYAEHWARRPRSNPIRAFQAVAVEQARALAGQPNEAFQDFAFHKLRLLGANFDMLGAGLVWLSGDEDPRAAFCRTIAETAKRAQFQLARAVARARFDGFAETLDPAAEAWDALFAAAPVRNAA